MKQQARLFLLAIAAVVLLGVSATAASAQNSSDQKSERFQRTFSLNSGGTLVVDNYKGTIHVSGSDGNQVMVDVYKRFDGSESDRKWWMDNLQINFHNDGGKVEVAVKYPNYTCVFCWSMHDYTAAVELEIRVPRQTNVRVESYKPDIRIAGIQGDIRINSYKSPIAIESTSGAIRIDTYKETIKLRDVTVRGALDVKSYKADAEISARSLGDTVNVETEKGSIMLRLPKNAGFDVDFSGGRRSSFHSDFPLTTHAGSRWDRDVRGTVNQGGAHLRLRTERGSVSLEKDSGSL
jgi:opacity protein-like surface antigen